MIEGSVYCFSNESMPGILKIGMTEKTPEERLVHANSSSTWNPPTPYKYEFSKKVLNPRETERKIHNLLSIKRSNPKREFFTASVEEVNLIFDMIDGEYHQLIHKNDKKILKRQLEKDKKCQLEEELIYNFISERVIKTDDNKDKIMKCSLAAEFKMWIQIEGERCPKLEKIYDYMDKKFGQYTDGWYGIRFHYFDEEENDIDL
jgi:hypothetical protein